MPLRMQIQIFWLRTLFQTSKLSWCPSECSISLIHGKRVSIRVYRSVCLCLTFSSNELLIFSLSSFSFIHCRLEMRAGRTGLTFLGRGPNGPKTGRNPPRKNQGLHEKTKISYQTNIKFTFSIQYTLSKKIYLADSELSIFIFIIFKS